MSNWAWAFLMIALLAGSLGFAGPADREAWIAQIVFGAGLLGFFTLVLFGRNKKQNNAGPAGKKQCAQNTHLNR